MCTAVSINNNGHYFGRTLDLEYSYNEQVIITPRNYPLEFRYEQSSASHYAFIGMGTLADDTPLYYDGMNEKGLCIAGLNFPDNARFWDKNDSHHNIATFELIPWILSNCKSVAQARDLIERTNIVKDDFNKDLKCASLHWIISDSKGSVVVESVGDGIKIYDNKIGVLTNNPPFPYHLANLSNYINLTPNAPTNRFCEKIDLDVYSKGMGAIGLPGDLSSTSRFVRAAFSSLNSVCENDSVTQFFHIMDTVQQIRGCNFTGEKYEITQYTSCCDTIAGVYYYTTYQNRRISAVNMFSENLDGDALVCFKTDASQDIFFAN